MHPSIGMGFPKCNSRMLQVVLPSIDNKLLIPQCLYLWIMKLKGRALPLQWSLESSLCNAFVLNLPSKWKKSIQDYPKERRDSPTIAISLCSGILYLLTTKFYSFMIHTILFCTFNHISSTNTFLYLLQLQSNGEDGQILWLVMFQIFCCYISFY